MMACQFIFIFCLVGFCTALATGERNRDLPQLNQISPQENLAPFMSIQDFFPQVEGNLTKITWAHAVNSKTYLTDTLKDASIMMLEADVVYGKLNGQGDNIPIMGHPPQTVSDLTLQDFLTTVFDYNRDPKNAKSRRGVKLDLKSTEVFEKAVPFINEIYSNIDYPIWINADIIEGPLNATTVPVDPTVFLAQSKAFTNSTLSLGWTTKYGGILPRITNASYTDEQIDQMVAAIQQAAITQNITFAVRAGIAAQSMAQMRALKDRVRDCTLTIWSSEGDEVDVQMLEDVIFEYGVERVFVDVPKELMDRLDLSSGNSLRRTFGKTVLAALVSVVLVR